MTERFRSTGYGDLTGPPDLRQVLASEPWRERAACRDEEDESLFFYEVSPYQSETPKAMASTSILLPMLLCAGCEVRRDCLRTALTPPPYVHQDEAAATTTIRTMFVWGGTT